MPLTKGQQTACLLGCARPCSSCCLNVHMGQSAQPDTTTVPGGPICTLPDQMKWRRVQQKPRLQDPLTVTTVTNLPVSPFPNPQPRQSPLPSAL